MSRARTYVWSALGTVTAVVAAVALLVLERSEAQRTQRYLELAETYTMAFSDRAALYLSRGRPEDLDVLANTASTLLFGNVILYVQVVADGQVAVEVRAPAGEGLALPLLEPERSVVLQRGTLADGTPYVDVTKKLLPLPGRERPLDGYVRIGTSLAQLQVELNNERLLTLGVSLGVWAVLALGIWLSARWLFRPTPRATAPETVQSEPAAEPAPEAPAVRQVGELVLDDARKAVAVRGRPVELSPKEFDVLRLLCSQPGRVFSSEEIIRAVWDENSFASAQDVKQYIYFLRRKLERNPKTPRLILTVRGFGYKVDPGAGKASPEA